jgi:hypothetical protein
MSCLKESAVEISTGDPVHCASCQAIFNFFSVITVEGEADLQKQVWNCEFCSHRNVVSIEPEEKAKSATISYIIEAAPVVDSKTAEEKKTDSGIAKDISIVYCIDVSGSMAGSRLTSVQQTIKAQIKEMAENHPDRKIGIVTFTSYVDIIGDGSAQPLRIDGNHMNDYNFLLKNAVVGASTQLSQPLNKARTKLEKAVNDLRATGSTALGPGMLTAVGMAGEGAPGS